MNETAISKFKATCLVLESVRRTGKPVRVTRFGKPIAEITPVQPGLPGRRSLSRMRGTGRIVGDIVAPAADESDWDALR